MNVNLKELGIDAEEIKRLVVEGIVDTLQGRRIDDDGRGVGDNFIEEVKSEVRKEINKHAGTVIEQRLTQVVDEILHGDFQPTDNWSEKKGPVTSLRNMIKDRSSTFLVEKVDSDGKVTSYNGAPRIDYVIAKEVKTQLTYEFQTAIATEVKRAKDHLREQVAKHITDTILKD